MKLHPEDPRLTAYLLGELSANEAAAVEVAIAADPALQVAFEEMQAVQTMLTESLAPGSLVLLSQQRENVLRAARLAEASAKPQALKSFPLRRKSWLIPLAAAALATLATSVFLSQPQLRNRSITQAPAPPKSPLADAPLLDPTLPQPVPPPATRPAGSDKTAAATPAADPVERPGFSKLRSLDSVTVGEFPTLELPIQAGNSSLRRIREFIRSEHRLPPRDSVRLEEILNNLPLRPTGLTVIARHPAIGWHPDNRENGSTTHAATLATESLACPWKPSASLVFISFRGNPLADCEIKALFRPNPANVRRYRLLGFAAPDGPPPADLPTVLAAKCATSLVIEIEPSTAASDLGSIEWAVNGKTAAPVTLVRQGEDEPSDDARFAALVCTFSQWLAGDPSSPIDKDLLVALARESASDSLSAECADFLNLIDQALNL
jgi:hypothetical protein